MNTFLKKAAIPAVALAAVSVGVALFACSSSSNPPPPSNTGGACTATAGSYPEPDCESSANQCAGIGTGKCVVDEATCGSKSTCLPMADNSGKSVIDLRIRRLTVVSPPVLAKAFIQKAVLDQGINLNANGKNGTPSCAENGDGSFNWLIRLDKTNGAMTTGGAPPPTATGAFQTGYCFVNGTFAGLTVAPIKGNVTLTGNTFTSDQIDINVPIFVHGDVNNVVILPLHKASFQKVTFSSDGNCIGSYNYAALDDSCLDAREDCSKWHTAGALGGYITLEEADHVDVVDLHQSLCVVLTESSAVPDANGFGRCKRDATNKVAFQGDYCSTSNKPGDCADSYWLAATFAASAVKINDGTGVPSCSGGSPMPDGGTDGASPADAAGD